ncbi:MAG: UDP-N-acetylmuramate:L-alanyl-gamma-D-glutamyl-meso-diaminopimelate ligase [Pseudomonadota bacterium]
MHLHILGICGTFMGGVAALARQAGHRVTGCDANVYPPMSSQLEALGIELIEGWQTDQLELNPDLYVIGNVVSRGNPLMEAILDSGAAYTSGPQWLADHVLVGKRVIAVSGTHGKTTTASLLAYLLDALGENCGFLIGGVPANFEVSARLGSSDWFVIEADEYDTAFFDKRAKFVHYRPEIALINNLEFDHADIYADLAAIQWQFHQMLRMVPAAGTLVIPADVAAIESVIEMGCWSNLLRFATPPVATADVTVALDQQLLDVELAGQRYTASTPLLGRHNAANVAAAVSLVHAAGLNAGDALAALPKFRSVARRLELVAQRRDVRLFDDFAHHPTALRMTLSALRTHAPGRRLIAVFEPRSNTMRMGVHQQTLAAALADADQLLVLRPAALDWDIQAVLHDAGSVWLFDDVGDIVAHLADTLGPGDDVVMLSNGGFAGLRGKLTQLIDGGSDD